MHAGSLWSFALLYCGKHLLFDKIIAAIGNTYCAYLHLI